MARLPNPGSEMRNEATLAQEESTASSRPPSRRTRRPAPLFDRAPGEAVAQS